MTMDYHDENELTILRYLHNTYITEMSADQRWSEIEEDVLEAIKEESIDKWSNSWDMLTQHQLDFGDCSSRKETWRCVIWNTYWFCDLSGPLYPNCNICPAYKKGLCYAGIHPESDPYKGYIVTELYEAWINNDEKRYKEVLEELIKGIKSISMEDCGD